MLQEYEKLVRDRLAELHARADKAAAGRSYELLGVSKTVDAEHALAAYRAGLRHFAENRPQELKKKCTAFAEAGIQDVHVDMIGNLQTNKINLVLPFAERIHSISSLHLAEAVSARAERAGSAACVLLEVNVSGEETKSGFSEAELMKSMETLLGLEGLHIDGFMTMAPAHDPHAARQTFRGLAQLAERLRKDTGLALETLSCGMSDDFEIALQEGSTCIRLGRCIFDPAYSVDRS